MKIRTWLVLTIGSILLTGCTTTAHSRHAAAVLANKLSQERETQQGRIEKLNRDYALEHGRLVTELEQNLDADFGAESSADAERVSDAIAAKLGDMTQPLVFSETMGSTVSGQLDRLEQMDSKFSQIRQTYADNYKTLQLQLKNLDDAYSKVLQLSVSPVVNREVVRALQGLYDSYEQLSSKTNQPVVTDNK